eukprot:TRINITY_DN20865_c0_g1_i1.p1 TRINITY_DN20865_c0_g1~~TRINITY_DN20865_c0_g1_i1.p1  ORF type:complete len:490 (+),score=74.31 TRINITY_DN20865_c0_g1_i1:95-1564(+)
MGRSPAAMGGADINVAVQPPERAREEIVEESAEGSSAAEVGSSSRSLRAVCSAFKLRVDSVLQQCQKQKQLENESSCSTTGSASDDQAESVAKSSEREQVRGGSESSKASTTCSEEAAATQLQAPSSSCCAERSNERDNLASRLLSIRRQIEWYMTDANLCTDHHLYGCITAGGHEGWMRLSVISRAASLQRLGATPRLILAALQASHLEVQVLHQPGCIDIMTGRCRQPDGCTFIRRRQPLPPLLFKECRGNTGEVPKDLQKYLLQDPFQTMNRLKDQLHVQATLGLREVGNDNTVFREKAIPGTTSSSASSSPGVIVATGYERILYGDHGAYVEVRPEQVNWEAWPHYFNKRTYNSYYDEYYTAASHKRWETAWEHWNWKPKGILLLYAQLHAVADRPWAPGASNENAHAFRPHGYADYRPGYFYFAADSMVISVETKDTWTNLSVDGAKSADATADSATSATDGPLSSAKNPSCLVESTNGEAGSQ